MDTLLQRSVFETLEEAYVSPYFMTMQIYPLGHETIFYTCHIINLDIIVVRFNGIDLVYSEGEYDKFATGSILGKSFSEIKDGFVLDLDPKVTEAIDSAVWKFYEKHKSMEDSNKK